MVRSRSLHFQFGISNKSFTQNIPNCIHLMGDAAKIADRYDQIFNSALAENTQNDRRLFVKLGEISEYSRCLTTRPDERKSDLATNKF